MPVPQTANPQLVDATRSLVPPPPPPPRTLVSLLVGSEHLVEKLVGHAAANELALRQNAVLVLVHFAENLLRAPLRRVSRVVVGQLRTDHVVDRLRPNKY